MYREKTLGVRPVRNEVDLCATVRGILRASSSVAAVSLRVVMGLLSKVV